MTRIRLRHLTMTLWLFAFGGFSCLIAILLTVSTQHLLESKSFLEKRLILLEESLAETSRDMASLEVSYNRMKTDYSRMLTISNISLELDLNPAIVEAFYTKALEYVDPELDWPTWRYTLTADYLTYMICSVVAAESEGDVHAVGDGGTSFGLTQMKLGTAQRYMKDTSQEDLLNLHTHVELATRHYVELLRESNGNHGLVVIKWNRGRRGVERLLAMGITPENGYISKVYGVTPRRRAPLPTDPVDLDYDKVSEVVPGGGSE